MIVYKIYDKVKWHKLYFGKLVLGGLIIVVILSFFMLTGCTKTEIEPIINKNPLWVGKYLVSGHQYNYRPVTGSTVYDILNDTIEIGFNPSTKSITLYGYSQKYDSVVGGFHLFSYSASPWKDSIWFPLNHLDSIHIYTSIVSSGSISWNRTYGHKIM